MHILRDIFFVSTDTTSYIYIEKDITKRYTDDIPDFSLDHVYVILDYSGPIVDDIESYKYKSQHIYARKFAKIYTDTLKNLDIQSLDYIIPPPSHFTRTFSRGFDHIGLIAQYISTDTHIPLLRPLFKTKITPHQARLNRKDRKKNIENSIDMYKKYREQIVGKNILFIDDVISTGSTAHECGKILCKYGAKNIYGLFLASSMENGT